MLYQPNFWKTKNTLSTFTLPLSFVFRFFYLLRFLKKPKKVNLPVICIGNISIGGSGKTPTVISISKSLKKDGKNIAVILRGYGGKLSGPIKVKDFHTTNDVGDEAKLHSKFNDTWISKNRYDAAKIITREKKYDLIILDDGLQNQSLKHDLKVCVFDSSNGIGNGRVFPSGPLRENLGSGLKKTDHAIIIGKKNTDLENIIHYYNSKLKITYGKFILLKDKFNIPLEKKIIAFSGIGLPKKFFNFLKKIKINPIKTIIFPDHFKYKNKDIDLLVQLAKQNNAVLLTTSKDLTKISELRNYKYYKNIIFEVPVLLKFPNKRYMVSLIKNLL